MSTNRWLLLLTILAIAIVSAVLFTNLRPDDQLRFESAAWKRSAPNERGRMLDDLLNTPDDGWRRRDVLLNEQSRLHGMTKDTVVEVLGPPDRESEQTAVYEHGVRFDHCISYDIGFLNGDGFMKATCWLTVGFNEHDVVSAIVIDQ